MSYLVIARKWRPQRFEDLVGQEPIVRLLRNSIEQGKIAHAYIFSGPRGVGKTSAARIFAKAINCEQGPTPQPCGSCSFCAQIAGGSSMDVLEIDGASNNSVEDIRDIREQVKYAPSSGRYKVYIIDEAHMLSESAFNALLKTLEEPPAHVIFVLATTLPRKIPLTVMSRCQHMPFRKISSQNIKERLNLIAHSEAINISKEAIDLIARAGDGSMRDSLTILDQVASSLSEINESDIKDLLGIADFTALMDMAEALLKGRREKILDIVRELSDRGADFRAFSKDLTRFLRDLLVMRVVSVPEEILDMSREEMQALKDRFPNASADILTLMLSEIIKTESDVRASSNPRVILEMSLIKASYLSALKPIKEIIADLEGRISDSGQSDPIPNAKEEFTALKENETVKEGYCQPEKAVSDPSIPLTPEAVLKMIIQGIDDPRITSKLSKAIPELKENTLRLTFQNEDAEICAEPLKEHKALIAQIASGILSAPIGVEINVSVKKIESRKALKEKIMSEPAVKEAMELFDGRIVDIRSKE